MPDPPQSPPRPLTQGGLHLALLERRFAEISSFHRLRGKVPEGRMGAVRRCVADSPSSGAARHLSPAGGRRRARRSAFSRLGDKGDRPGILEFRRDVPSTACGGRCPKGGWGQRGDVWRIPSSGAARHLLPQAGEGERGSLHPHRLRDKGDRSGTLEFRRDVPSTACGGRCPKGGWGQCGDAWRIPPHPALRATFSRRREKESEAVCILTAYGIRGIVPEPWSSGWMCLPPLAGEGARRADGGSAGMRGGFPHPALRATFSRRREKESEAVCILPAYGDQCAGLARCLWPRRPATQFRSS
jgi:hypothetical protein